METAGFLRSRSALVMLVACCARQSWLAMAQASASVRQERDLVQEAVQTGAWQVPQKRRETPYGHSDYLRLYTDLTSSGVVHELSGFMRDHVGATC